MLVEYYEPDKLFEEVVEYMPKMATELVKIDAYLEDEKLFRLIKKDLSQRYPKTCQTGRNSTPVEVILRMLVVKRLYSYSYEETEQRVSDSLRLRQFCRPAASRAESKLPSCLEAQIGFRPRNMPSHRVPIRVPGPDLSAN